MTRLRSFADSALRHAQGRPEQRRGTARQVMVTAALAVGGGSTIALACPVCFGAEETSMVDGTKLGIMVLLGLTLVVQGGFVAFFLYLRNRAKQSAEIELDTEWSELQRGASRAS